MPEPVLVTVILKPVPDPSGSESMAHAFAMLKDWAATQNLTVQPPVNTDAETLRFAVVLTSDVDQADALIADLLGKAFVDTSYRKPADALP
ncbi:hypothetical protein [Roseovarius litorisediminis]|uniref:hypothetical protein n=1 Tax=Roseovarius litorisediminis TaxID=1312363 RepID=UPI00159449B5|nr:hypothetical protein [Roseovarius litorisediminis]